ncbi:UNKNOWN [Stylonychia lemnae]|uniref:TRP C-terminal domain-containing protein n=1 Tax=Stylonychia lemnae TaxID=5949 RepID=A0A078ADT8_STYLE|nr:UNKNOWN [Stylonychia lemnae]|eukprot:CDW80374.1 UNKNOWN [Stylonychia lemnae]
MVQVKSDQNLTRQQIYNYKSYPGNQVYEMVYSSDQRYIYFSTSCNYYLTYRNGIGQININDPTNPKIFTQNNKVEGQGQDRELMIKGLSANDDLVVGVMFHQNKLDGQKIGVTVLIPSQDSFKLYYQDDLNYNNIDIQSSMIINNTFVRFFMQVYESSQSQRYQQIGEFDLTKQDKIIFKNLQDYPFKWTFYTNMLVRNISQLFIFGSMKQKYGYNSQAFINPYIEDPTCKYQQPIGNGQSYNVKSEVDLGVDYDSIYIRIKVISFEDIKPMDPETLIKGEFKNVYNNQKPCDLPQKGFEVITPESKNETVKCFVDIPCFTMIGEIKAEFDCSNLNNSLKMNLYNSSENNLWNYVNLVQLQSQADSILSIKYNLTFQVFWPCEIGNVSKFNDQNIYLLRNRSIANVQLNMFKFVDDNSCFKHEIQEVIQDDSPPFFKSYVPKLITAPNLINYYDIPKIQDNQGDNYTLIINFGEAFPFITLKDERMKISPTLNESGKYVVIFQLKQVKYPNLSSFYHLDIIVENQKNNDTNQSLNSKTFQMTNSAIITSINATGFAIVKFKDKLFLDTIAPLECYQFVSDIIAPSNDCNQFSSQYSVYTQLLQLSDEIDYPMNDYFSQYGYNSINVIINLGTIFMILVINILIIFLTLMLKVLTRLIPRLRSLYKWVVSKLFMNYYIRFFLEAYLELALCSLINFQLDKRISSSFGQRIGVIASTLIMISIFLFPMLILLLLVAYQNQLDEPENIRKFGSCYELYRTDRLSILLRDEPIYQIIILMVSSLAILIYIINYKPCKSKFDNYLEIFNELSVLASFYVQMCYTDFLNENSQIKMNIGWVLIFISCGSYGVNMLIILIMLLVHQTQSISRICKLMLVRIKQFIRLYMKARTKARITQINLEQQKKNMKNPIAFLNKQSQETIILKKNINLENILNNEDQGIFVQSIQSSSPINSSISFSSKKSLIQQEESKVNYKDQKYQNSTLLEINNHKISLEKNNIKEENKVSWSRIKRLDSLKLNNHKSNLVNDNQVIEKPNQVELFNIFGFQLQDQNMYQRK